MYGFLSAISLQARQLRIRLPKKSTLVHQPLTDRRRPNMRRRRSFLNTILGVVIAAGACASNPVSSADPEPPSYSLLGSLSAVLVNCTPEQYTVASAVIGSAGGVLRIGQHTLVIPSGALTASVTIQGEVVSGSVNSVRFSPEGLTFRASPTLTMSYRNCSGLGMLLPKKIVFTDERLSLLQILRSLDLPAEKLVSAPLSHFSRYAIAY
jgi:hypothetical protein